jgi:hypothetical protein
VATLPDLLNELRLNVTIWEPLDPDWCFTNGSDLFQTALHLQLNHGIISRMRPPLDDYQILQESVRIAMERALAAPTDASPAGCAVHGSARISSINLWWQRRLLQHTPDILAEAMGTDIIAYYKDIAITLSQSSVKALHRSFVTTVGASMFELLSTVPAGISFRKSSHRLLSLNPLTAAYLATSPSDGVRTIAGKIAFRHFLESRLTDLLQGPSAAQTRAILSRTVGQPDLPLQPWQDDVVGQSMLDTLRASSLTVWRSCCPLNSWYTRENSPGSHYTTLACLPIATGFATDGVNFFAVPGKHELLEAVTRIRSGLMDGLINYSLAPSGPRDHPSWTHVLPQYRFFAQWNHPA